MATSKFAQQVVNRVKGDEAEALGAKIERKAKNALSSQVSSLSSKKVDAETAVEDAKAALEDAIYPSAMIGDQAVYVHGIKTAQSRLDAAEENLNAIEESISFYETLIEEKF